MFGRLGVLLIVVLQQKQRQSGGKYPVLIPVGMRVKVGLERLVEFFGDFCQNADIRIHNDLLGAGAGD